MSPDRPRLLVTGAGGPSAVGVLRAVGAERYELLAGDIDPYAAGLYLVERDARMILPRGDDPRFAEIMLDVCERARVDVLVPTVDSELLALARARAAFAEAGVALVVASVETLEACLDKWRLHAACAGSAVRVPRTQLVDDAFDATSVALPVIVKPRHGSGSRGVFLAEARAELERLPRDGTLLVQEHLPGAEHSLDVLADADGTVRAVVPRARLKLDSGIAVTGRTLHDEALQAVGRAVAERIGLTTVANVQVKDDAGGRPALLEVNPRFPGTMPLTVAAGVNMPALAVAEALGTPIPAQPLDFEDVAMVRFLEERVLAVDELIEMVDARDGRVPA